MGYTRISKVNVEGMDFEVFGNLEKGTPCIGIELHRVERVATLGSELKVITEVSRQQQATH